MVIEYFVAALIIVLLVVINGIVMKNRQLPGPFPIPFIGSGYVFFRSISPEWILPKLTDLLKKYNGVFSLLFIKEEYIFISKPELVHVFCTSHHLLDHAAAYDNFKPALGDGLLKANGASWKVQRKAWTPSFHPSVIGTFVKSFQDFSDIFIEKLQKEINGAEFPLYPYTRDYAIDSMFFTQFEYNHNSQREFRNLNKTLEAVAAIVYGRFLNVFLHNETVFKLSAGGKKLETIMNYVRENITSIIRDKTVDFENEGHLDDNNVRRKLFLRQLLDRKASKKEICDEIMTLMMTGTDTISQAIGFIALMLGKHQDVQDKVYVEDQEIQRQLNGRKLEMDDLRKYVYLDRVIKETLRIFPIAPIIGRKATQDMKMGDTTVFKGTTVQCCILALHRNSEVYPNPLKFNPDNFLPERIAERHPYSYVPFSAGPKNCIGTKYALTSLKVAVSALVRNYRLFSNKNVEDIKLRVKVTMTDADDFLVRIEKR